MDHAGDPGGFKIFQDADPLVSRLNVEISVIFVTNDGIADALAQVGGAELDPLDGKLRVPAQQGQKRGREGTDAACGLGAHDAVCGNLHQTHGNAAVCGDVTDELVQHGGIGRAALGLTLPDLLQAQLQGFLVFLHGFRTAHDRTSFGTDTIIIQPRRDDCNRLAQGFRVILAPFPFLLPIQNRPCFRRNRGGGCLDYLTYSMTTRRLGSVPVEWVVMLSISCREAWIT